ncbi:MAG: glycine reductase, partial [Firmicutes bacterium]|nr:glycine reductase [Bacillota bacterium]
VDTAIVGIEVMDLEDAVQALWREEIYAESGMGCTGPVIMVSAAKLEQAAKVLKDNGFEAGVE